MATAIHTGEVKPSSAEPCAWPTREAVDDAVRAARRAVHGARAATEDFVAERSLDVRRHPLAAVGLAGTAGLLAGCLFGFAAAWVWRGRS